MLTDDRRRHAQAGRLQQGRGQVLVHTDFDGPRRVEDADAGRLEPVQQVHAEDDVLQRPRRHGADQDGVERGQGEPGRVSARSLGEPGRVSARSLGEPGRVSARSRSGHRRGDAAEIDCGRLVAERGGGAVQVADVPTVAGREESDAHGGIL